MMEETLQGVRFFEFLTEEESAKSSRGRNVPRAWSLWKHEMTGQP